ncbi:hypothetical protein [Glycomyces niveus]|uniref:DUF3558 domain-containing protein n=1 Tax=Glycomyces niveus TaxID=2820287 RepID=A0ABS3TZL3_9ACTN|nr:hypothetical protein [Glycomyces sp. NEAU-S30]MBO3731950.1 hypothetical protein [Glycomyces sp. NEAU-S30]
MSYPPPPAPQPDFRHTPPPAPQRMPLWAKALIAIAIVVTVLLLLFVLIETLWIGKQIDRFLSAGESEATTGPPPDFAADFNETVCHEFDLAVFDEFAGGASEFETATAYPDEIYTPALSCGFVTPDGQQLSVSIAASKEDGGYGADAVFDRRKGYEENPGWQVEDLTSGSLTGFSAVYPGGDATETYAFEGGYERIMIRVSVEYEGSSRREAAAGVAAEVASQALVRFLDYA